MGLILFYMGVSVIGTAFIGAFIHRGMNDPAE